MKFLHRTRKKNPRTRTSGWALLAAGLVGVLASSLFFALGEEKKIDAAVVGSAAMIQITIERPDAGAGFSTITVSMNGVPLGSPRPMLPGVVYTISFQQEGGVNPTKKTEPLFYKPQNGGTTVQKTTAVLQRP